MKQDKSSTTAEGMAIVRAIESKKIKDNRICYDPIASKLVNPISVFLSKMTIDSGIYDRFFAPEPGVIEFIAARERYIDDYLKKSLNEGIDQVVILGAGFDTRPYRIDGIEKTRVFEIDLPATQNLKLKRLKKVITPLPKNITYVPVDFNTQSLRERLLENGYNETGKTLFIWQGVTMYLTPEGVDKTLSFISNNSGNGSSVIFDYFYNETLRDMKMKTAKKITQALGETITFGIDKGCVDSLLTKYGLSDIHNADAEELKQLYFTGMKAKRPISSGAAIVSAKLVKRVIV